MTPDTLAIVGSTRITKDDFIYEYRRLEPYIRLRFSSAERKKGMLEDLVQLELLAQQAGKEGMDQDPLVLRYVKRAMVDQLIKQLHHELVKLEDISDTDVRQYYQTHKRDYTSREGDGTEAPLPLDQVAARIRNRLFAQRRTEAVKAYVARLREGAKIQIFDKNLPQGRRQKPRD